MTAEEKKAEELFEKFQDVAERHYETSETWYSGIKLRENKKKCALIAVEYLIEEQTMWQNGQADPVLFWQDVKEAINKI